MTMDDAASRRLASEINVTPMIDVLLVLLIIFMLVVPVASKGESTNLPHPAYELAPADAVVLEILKDRAGSAAYRINQRSVSWAELPARLAEIYSRRAQRVLFIKGDDRLSFRQVAEVIDIGHAAGVDRVSLMTSPTGQLRP